MSYRLSPKALKYREQNAYEDPPLDSRRCRDDARGGPDRECRRLAYRYLAERRNDDGSATLTRLELQHLLDLLGG